MGSERQKGYERVAEELRRRITLGEFASDGKLPTERELSEIMDVSRVTVRTALQRLEDEKLVSRIQGSGTFVSRGVVQGASLAKDSICLVFKENHAAMLEDPFASMLLDGLKRASSRLGFRIGVMPLPPSRSFMDCLRANPKLAPDAKGVILATREDFEEVYEWLTERGHAVVSLGPPPKGFLKPHSYVDMDNKAGGLAAARRLLSLGRRELAFIGGRGGASESDLDRIEGIKAAFSELGLSFDASRLRFTTPWSESEGRAAVLDLLKSFPSLDGLIVYGDMATFGALDALAKAGRKVPEDVSVISYADYPWMRKFCRPLVTSVSQPFDAMAEAAAKILMEAMGSFRVGVKVKIIQPTLAVRDSCCLKREAVGLPSLSNA